MLSTLGSFFIGSGIMEWAVGMGVAAFMPFAYRMFKKAGWDIDQIHAQQFQTAVTNAAGVLAQKIAAGQFSLASAGQVALDLARILIRDNPDTVKGLGVAGKAELVAEKILAKVPLVAADVVIRGNIPVSGTAAPSVGMPIIGSAGHVATPVIGGSGITP
jgi:hypothetical protein